MQQSSVLGFSWDFLDEMAAWSLALGCALGVIGGLLLASLAFAAGCILAVALDVALVRIATHRARRELDEGRIDAVAPTLMLAGRLVVKAALFVVAIFVPQVLGFTGTVVGALTFDITLILIGSVIAVSRTMQRPKEGR